ncbi:hypothetical protein EVAR_76487_1 [Eumeta japonica]|uniref:Uncharacterized protein n=1 Tax=Eumeta variegata TaxID=151549 RepID=A0A4C1T830_EUMVA|nr:hypothetical protein EVAR_76487_1 [Eumeta japonica]
MISPSTETTDSEKFARYRRSADQRQCGRRIRFLFTDSRLASLGPGAPLKGALCCAAPLKPVLSILKKVNGSRSMGMFSYLLNMAFEPSASSTQMS